VTGTLTAGTSLVKNPFVANTTTTQAHGLSTTPSFLFIIWECLVIDAGWAVGDKLIVSAAIAGSAVTPSFQVYLDATNVYLVLPIALPGILSKTSGSGVAIVAASWKITVVPYKLT
jgi:hypothetical protein